MTSFCPTQTTGTQSPTPTLNAHSSLCAIETGQAASAVSYAGMSDEEIECHINCCTRRMEAAYARFERFGVPADRDAAIELLHMRDEAIKARSPSQVARMEAELAERIDAGVNYFAAAGARDAAEIRQGAVASV